MLSTRYANSFPVLEEMIANSMLPEFIDNMLQQNNEDRLWEMYLATAVIQDKSFEDWKAAAMDSRERQECREPTPGCTPEEAVIHAEGILAGFKPF